MPIFQVGIEITKEVCADLIVRVEAPDEEAAFKTARSAMREKLSKANGLSYEAFPRNHFEWQESHCQVTGRTEEDYSNETSYGADIDLVEKSR